MEIPAKKIIAKSIAGVCLGIALSTFLGGGPVMAAEKLPPCQADKPIPPGGCMAPKDPVTPLDQLRPAPPLNVPPGAVPPGSLAPGALPPPSDAVIKPPPTGDGEILKPPPQSDSKMPVVKPPTNPEPKT